MYNTDILTINPETAMATPVSSMYSPAPATTTTRPVPVAARSKRPRSAVTRRKTRLPPKTAQPMMRKRLQRRPCESGPALDAVSKLLDGVFGSTMAEWAFTHFLKPGKWPIDEQKKLIHNVEKTTMLHFRTIYNGENTDLLE